MKSLARNCVPAKADPEFRMYSRRADADVIRRAFPGHRSSYDLSKEAAPKLGVDERTVRNWLAAQHDMPTWALRALHAYIEATDRLARKIEGRD